MHESEAHRWKAAEFMRDHVEPVPTIFRVCVKRCARVSQCRRPCSELALTCSLRCSLRAVSPFAAYASN
jgi:hypothetical protein